VLDRATGKSRAWTNPGGVDKAASGCCCDTFIDGAGLVLGLRLLQLGRRTGLGHALASTIIAVECPSAVSNNNKCIAGTRHSPMYLEVQYRWSDYLVT
jgi:hypothetical protein